METLDNTNGFINTENPNSQASPIFIEDEHESQVEYNQIINLPQSEQLKIMSQLLNEKLNKCIGGKISHLENKFNADLQEIEVLKYEFYENLKKFNSYTKPEEDQTNSHISSNCLTIPHTHDDDPENLSPDYNQIYLNTTENVSSFKYREGISDFDLLTTTSTISPPTKKNINSQNQNSLNKSTIITPLNTKKIEENNSSKRKIDSNAPISERTHTPLKNFQPKTNPLISNMMKVSNPNKDKKKENLNKTTIADGKERRASAIIPGSKGGITTKDHKEIKESNTNTGSTPVNSGSHNTKLEEKSKTNVVTKKQTINTSTIEHDLNSSFHNTEGNVVTAKTPQNRKKSVIVNDRKSQFDNTLNGNLNKSTVIEKPNRKASLVIKTDPIKKVGLKTSSVILKKNTITTNNSAVNKGKNEDTNTEGELENKIKNIVIDPDKNNDEIKPESKFKKHTKIINLETLKNKSESGSFSYPEQIEKSTNYIKSLYLIMNSKFVDNSLKFKILTSIPIIKNNYNLTSLISEKIGDIQKRVDLIDNVYSKYFNDIETLNLITKMFTPSKTAQNGLTFVSKTEEQNLCKKDQPEDIINVFRIIYIIMNKSMDDIPSNKIVDNLINRVLPEMGIENLKNLFVKHITKISDFDDSQYSALCEIILNNPKVLSSTDFIKINRCVSYMTFIIKEAWDYFSLKTSDGLMVYKLRKIFNEKNQLLEKIECLKKKLDS